MTLSELNRLIVSELEPSLGRGEATATSRLLLEDTLGVDPTTLLTRGEREIEPETETRFRDFIRRIKSGEPPQYVVGRARFMGMDLKVTPATLIPRPETAELVDIVTDYADRRSDLRILDVGTGSGCIAIALARALPFPKVTAVDISREALDVAGENAERLRAEIVFIQTDFLKDRQKVAGEYDIIVSNPPYIAESERASMESRVKDHEPKSALFVPDSDPLVFYRAISDFALENNVPKIFLEINPLFASDLHEMALGRGFDCEIILDSSSRQRFAVLTNTQICKEKK